MIVDNSSKAEHGPGNETRAFYHELRDYPRVVAATMGLSVAILLYGFDSVIIGIVASVPAFQLDFGEYLDYRFIIPSEWLSAWTAASPIGIILGALVAAWLQDRCGRKLSLTVGNLLTAAGVAVCFASNQLTSKNEARGVFLFGKIVEGIGLGNIICTTQTFISEITPPKLRSAALALIPIFTLLGQLVGAAVVYALLEQPGSKSYTIAFASQWPFSLVLLLVVALIPESLPYLIRKGDFVKASQTHRRLYRIDTGPMTVESLTETIRLENEANNGEQGSFAACFAGTNARRTWIVILTHNVPQFFGITLLSNASYFMQLVGMSSSDSLMFLLVGIGIGIFSNILSIWCLAIVRRRPLLIYSLCIAGILWLSLGIAGCWNGNISMWYLGGCMMVIMFVCGCGAWPSSVVVASEVSSLQLRGVSQSIGWLSFGLHSGLQNIVLPYIYNVDQGNLKGKTGFIFAFVSMLACFLCWLFVPEMKDLAPAEIDDMFEHSLSSCELRNYAPVSRETEKSTVKHFEALSSHAEPVARLTRSASIQQQDRSA